MFCGSVGDFAVLVSKLTYLEKKMKGLQKSIKALGETLEKNQAEVRSFFEREGPLCVAVTPRKDYCSIRL